MDRDYGQTITPLIQDVNPVRDVPAASAANNSAPPPANGAALLSSSKAAVPPSTGAVTEDEVRAVVLHKAPITTQDLLSHFNSRLQNKEDVNPVKDLPAASAANNSAPPANGAASSSSKAAVPPSTGPVTEHEIRAFLLHKASPIPTQDLVSHFKSRLPKKEDKEAFARIFRRIAKTVKTNGHSHVILRVPPLCTTFKRKEKGIQDKWTDQQVLSLCDFLIARRSKHGRSSTFKWIELQPEFEKSINHKFISEKALENKFHTMLRDYNIWKLLTYGLTRPEWDESTKKLNCSEVWWKMHITKFPYDKKFQCNPPSMELQEAWDHLFGRAVASGANCVASSMDPSSVNEVFSENLEDSDVGSGKDVDVYQGHNKNFSQIQNLERQEDTFLNELGEGREPIPNQSGGPTQFHKHTKMSTKPKPKPVKMKRKGRESSGTTMLKDYLSQSNANQQEIIQLLKSDASSANKTSKFSIEAVLSVISRMVEEGLMIEGDEFWMFAMDLFEDSVKREMFMNLPNDNCRLSWLHHKQNLN